MLPDSLRQISQPIRGARPPTMSGGRPWEAKFGLSRTWPPTFSHVICLSQSWSMASHGLPIQPPNLASHGLPIWPPMAYHMASHGLAWPPTQPPNSASHGLPHCLPWPPNSTSHSLPHGLPIWHPNLASHGLPYGLTRPCMASHTAS